MSDERRKILEDAAGLICGDRNKQHGNYTVEAHRIADLWSAISKSDIAPEDVPLMMVALKLARASAGSVNRDDFVDIAGYAALAWQMHLDAGRGKP